MPTKEPTNINIPIGVLNNITPPPGNRISATTSAAAVSRKSQKIARTPSVFKNISKFKAIVLRIKRDVSGPGPGIDVRASDHAPASWANRIFGANSPVSQTIADPLFQIWARIPELHAGLEPPVAAGENASNRDNWLIDQHDIFIAESTDVPPCQPGDIVWVDYGNRGTYSDPIYLGPVVADRATPKTINGSVSSGEVHANGGGPDSGGKGSILNGSSPSGDLLPGSNVPISTSGNEFQALNKKAQYIWWLYEHQVKKLGEIRNYWMNNNRARLKAYTVYAANYWIKKLNAQSYITHTGLFGSNPLDNWAELSQIVWGVMWRECRHNPIGIHQHDPRKAINKGHATAYGMSQVPRFRFIREKNKDSKKDALSGEANFALKDTEHWQLLDPVKAIDLTTISYIRLFRKYGKTGQHFYHEGGVKYWMKLWNEKDAKNKFIFGIWWAGGNETKCQRKNGDIIAKGPGLWTGGTKKSTAEDSWESFGAGDMIAQFQQRPQPKLDKTFDAFRASFTGNISFPATSPSSKEKNKQGEKTQTPSTATPLPQKGSNTQASPGAPPLHTKNQRGTGPQVPKKSVIADIDSKWKKGTAFSANYKRRASIDQIIIHESFSGSRSSHVKYLESQNFGVHFVIDRTGGVTQHIPVDRRTSHAKKHNDRAVGIELINIFYGKHWKSSMGGEVLPVDFLWKTSKNGGYIANTKAQLKSLEQVIDWTLRKVSGISSKVSGQRSQEFYWGSGDGKFANNSGVMPHNWCAPQHRHHDGLFATHYMWCVLNLAMNSSKAYNITKQSIISVGNKKTPPGWTSFNIKGAT